MTVEQVNDWRTYFSGAVDVVDVEDVSQPVQQRLSESGNQLGGRHQHVHTVLPVTMTTIQGYNTTMKCGSMQ